MILIQARSTSQRFKGKSLMELNGKPLIRHVWDNCKASGFPVCLIVPHGDEIADYAREHEMLCFEGSEHNVLERYFRAARTLGWSKVCRVTGDCPMISPAVLHYMCTYSQKLSTDFFTNATLGVTDGQEIEIMSMRALEWAHTNAVGEKDKEHVTTFIKKNQKVLEKMGWVWATYRDPQTSKVKMSVDTPEDLKAVSKMLGE